VTRFKNFIAGQWVDASSGETFDNVNPADTSDIIGSFPLSSSEDVARAVASARRGFEIWRATPAAGAGEAIEAGTEVTVTGVDGVTVEVK